MALAWAGMLATGFAGLLKYESTPNQVAAPSAASPFSDGKNFSLVMALHPHCPCSRASVGELIKIYSHAHEKLAITILAFKPNDEPDSWIESSTMKSIAKMNPRIVLDADGAMAKEFGLNTSGQVLLYAPEGKLLFNGGITSARAHSGDNLGEDAVLSLIRGEAPGLNSTAVFGCPISLARKDP